MVLLLRRVIHGSSLTSYAFCIIAFWKGNTLRLAPDKRKLSVNILVWLLNFEGHWYGSAEAVGAVSSRKVADKVGQLSVKASKNRSITLCSQCMRRPPQATFLSLSSDSLSFRRNWLENIQLIGWSLNFSPCETINQSVGPIPNHCTVWDRSTLLLRASVYCSLRRWAGPLIVPQLGFLLLNQISLILPKWNGRVV